MATVYTGVSPPEMEEAAPDQATPPDEHIDPDVIRRHRTALLRRRRALLRESGPFGRYFAQRIDILGRDDDLVGSQ